MRASKSFLEGSGFVRAAFPSDASATEVTTSNSHPAGRMNPGGGRCPSAGESAETGGASSSSASARASSTGKSRRSSPAESSSSEELRSKRLWEASEGRPLRFSRSLTLGLRPWEPQPVRRLFSASRFAIAPSATACRGVRAIGRGGRGGRGGRELMEAALGGGRIAGQHRVRAPERAARSDLGNLAHDLGLILLARAIREWILAPDRGADGSIEMANQRSTGVLRDPLPAPASAQRSRRPDKSRREPSSPARGLRRETQAPGERVPLRGRG